MVKIIKKNQTNRYGAFNWLRHYIVYNPLTMTALTGEKKTLDYLAI